MTSAAHSPGRVRRAALAVTATMVVATVPLVAGPAQSAPAGCPTPYPIHSLAVGAPVNGLTVSSGTTPDAFSGTVQGVLEDGVAPGVDLVLADLHSTAVDRVGIWAGMSGSPVYSADGRLIGAVAYSLSFGPSTVAGITPATEMSKLLDAAPTSTRRASRTVRVPRRMAARIVRSGAASAAALRRGLTPIRVPVQLSGLTAARMAKLSKKLGLDDGRVVAGAAGPTSAERIGIQAGGNMAASMSYGTVTSAGLGTATIVCGGQVVGFGHPMRFSGPSTMSLHGARALMVQDDPTFSGFKVANLGAPIGRVDQDRLVGLRGIAGAPPSSVPITSRAGEKAARSVATTHVTQPEVLPELAFLSMHAAQDRVLDRMSKGTAVVRWSIKGLRKNGKPFELSRRDLFTDSYDVSSSPAYEVAGQVYALQENPGETVTITSIDTTSWLRDYSDTYVVAKVQARVRGAWTTARRNRTLGLREGRSTRLKVFLTSREAAPRVMYVRVAVPKGAAGKTGSLTVAGGNNGSGAFEDEEFFDFEQSEAPSPSTLSRLLRRLESAQHNDEIRVTLRMRGFRNGMTRTRRGSETISRAVGGRIDVRVRGLR